jgi:hypothetical protein
MCSIAIDFPPLVLCALICIGLEGTPFGRSTVGEVTTPEIVLEPGQLGLSIFWVLNLTDRLSLRLFMRLHTPSEIDRPNALD